MKKVRKIISIKRLWVEMVIIIAVLGGLAQGGSVLLDADSGNGQLAMNYGDIETGSHSDSCCCVVE